MYSGETRRKIIVISVLAALFVGYVFIDRSGIIKTVQLPSGSEWYFRLLGLVLPLVLFGIAVWKRQIQIATGTGIMLASSVSEFLVGIGTIGIWGHTLALALLFAGCCVIAWHSANFNFSSKWLRFIGILPAFFGITALVWFPLDGLYSVLVAVLTAVISLGVAILYFSGKGDVLAIAAFLIMAFKYTLQASPWVSWLAPVLNATGFFLVGYFMADRSWRGVDKV